MSKAKQNFPFSALTLCVLTSTAASHFGGHQIRELWDVGLQSKTGTRTNQKNDTINADLPAATRKPVVILCSEFPGCEK